MLRHLKSSHFFGSGVAVLGLILGCALTPWLTVPVGPRLEFDVPAVIVLSTLSGVVLAGAVPVPRFARVSTRWLGSLSLVAMTLSLVLLIGVLFTFGSIGAVSGGVVGMSVRNVLFGVGSASLAAIVLPRRLSWMPPVAFVLTAMIAGRSPDGTVRPWAFVVETEAALEQLAWVAVAAAGSVALRAALTRTRLTPDVN